MLNYNVDEEQRMNLHKLLVRHVGTGADQEVYTAGPLGEEFVNLQLNTHTFWFCTARSLLDPLNNFCH